MASEHSSVAIIIAFHKSHIGTTSSTAGGKKGGDGC